MTHVARIIFAQKFSTHSHTHFHTEIANDHKHTKSNNLIVPLNSSTVFSKKNKIVFKWFNKSWIFGSVLLIDSKSVLPIEDNEKVNDYIEFHK